jgi:hypothetical protein
MQPRRFAPSRPHEGCCGDWPQRLWSNSPVQHEPCPKVRSRRLRTPCAPWAGRANRLAGASGTPCREAVATSSAACAGATLFGCGISISRTRHALARLSSSREHRRTRASFAAACLRRTPNEDPGHLIVGLQPALSAGRGALVRLAARSRSPRTLVTLWTAGAGVSDSSPHWAIPPAGRAPRGVHPSDGKDAALRLSATIDLPCEHSIRTVRLPPRVPRRRQSRLTALLPLRLTPLPASSLTNAAARLAPIKRSSVGMETLHRSYRRLSTRSREQ